jgi:hypothetical protein
VNDPPEVVATLAGDTLSWPGPALQLTGLAETVFRDADRDALAVTSASSAPSVVATVDSGAVVTLEPQAVGDAEITLTASDGSATTAAAPFAIVVVPGNGEDAPSEQASAVVTPTSEAQTLNFADTGTELSVGSVQQGGRVTVRFFRDTNGPSTAARLAGSTDEIADRKNAGFETISPYRWEIDPGRAQLEAVEAAFRLRDADLRGIGRPDSVVILVDSTGDGSLVALETRFEDGGTPSDPADDQIVATDMPGRRTVVRLASNSPSNPLPVELARFTATTSREAVTLRWATASETNNAGFEVKHRSPNAPDYATIGFVEGAGTTTEPQSYQFQVEDLAVGTHRFRLRQVDVGGTATLTDPVRVIIEAAHALTLDATGPNPVRQTTRFTFTVKQSGRATVVLYNVLGQQVQVLHEHKATVGQRYTVDVSAANLPSGLYFVRLYSNGRALTQKLTVVQ